MKIGTFQNTPNTLSDGDNIRYSQVDNQGNLKVNLAASTSTVSITTIPTKSTIGTVTSQADQNTNVTLLAANANRKGASVFNDSDQLLYLKMAATATTTDFTVRLNAGQYFEVPFNYTGIIDGIWAANSTGSARITEYT